jgi:DNA-binding CsgD family transcriptional regulator
MTIFFLKKLLYKRRWTSAFDKARAQFLSQSATVAECIIQRLCIKNKSNKEFITALSWLVAGYHNWDIARFFPSFLQACSGDSTLNEVTSTSIHLHHHLVQHNRCRWYRVLNYRMNTTFWILYNGASLRLTAYHMMSSHSAVLFYNFTTMTWAVFAGCWNSV